MSEDEELHSALTAASEELTRHLEPLDITITVSGRVKHLWSIKKKTERDGTEPHDLPDLLGLRVICLETEDCYRILAAVHELWEPDLQRLKDYINRPKFNAYQSLHTTVTGPGGRRIEVQVRTREMHHAAEHGSAAHYAYNHPGQRSEWLNRLVDWSDEATDDETYLAGVQDELGRRREILTLTPQGRVVRLPEGGTVVDFAYAVHSNIGDRCVGAKVDGRITALSRVLINGETVEILTGNRAGPSQEWLEWVVTAKARSRIRAALRADTTPGTPNTTPSAPTAPTARIVRHSDRAPTALVVAAAGLRGTETRVAGCCKPQPGTLILGFAARGSVNVHRADCETARHVDTETPGRVVKVYWVQSGHHVETVRITVQARAGILTELAGSISGAGGTLLDTTPHGAEMLLQIETDQRHQARVRQAIGLLEGVKVVK